ncbi:hypothetical protein PENTCL1PPCAC_25672 [Pristionchus entomophagus]|uniref:Uncharacterized protein n=1 Tax=Pristionchus entomophagus TaxID=358040 RepID=A0AAV5UA06_9BILA|nr:hypothetical protein PENTCL1PPCAC_25672 [Pristionchus entomophagus]
MKFLLLLLVCTTAAVHAKPSSPLDDLMTATGLSLQQLRDLLSSQIGLPAVPLPVSASSEETVDGTPEPSSEEQEEVSPQPSNPRSGNRREGRGGNGEKGVRRERAFTRDPETSTFYVPSIFDLA